MKFIPLTKDKFTIVDNEDWEYLNKWKWQISTKGYAVRTQRIGLRKFNKKKTIWMHRLINNTKNYLQTDHINGNKLDNRKKNLRNATGSQNLGNIGLSKHNTSGYKGVSFSKNRGKWEAYITIKDKKKNLGRFETSIGAALRYNEIAQEYFGEYAKLNSMDNFLEVEVL